MGSGGAEGRRATTPDVNFSDQRLAGEDARQQAWRVNLGIPGPRFWRQ
jgi:hypothetical protein